MLVIGIRCAAQRRNELAQMCRAVLSSAAVVAVLPESMSLDMLKTTYHPKHAKSPCLVLVGLQNEDSAAWVRSLGGYVLHDYAPAIVETLQVQQGDRLARIRNGSDIEDAYSAFTVAYRRVNRQRKAPAL